MRFVVFFWNGIFDGVVVMFSGYVFLFFYVGVNFGVEGVCYVGGVRVVGVFGDVVWVGGEGFGFGGVVYGWRSVSRVVVEVLVVGGIYVRIDVGVEGVG